jgi:alanine racemase
MSRPTWAEISTSALRHNYRAIRAHVGEGVAICAVIKADAYGHGVIGCARALADEKPEYFGVTCAEEGIALREAGIAAPILLMTGFWKGEAEAIVGHGLTPVVSDWWQVGELEEVALAAGKRVPVHIKVDTGMARLGMTMKYLEKFTQRVLSAQPLVLEGLMSHLASAEVLDDAGATQQVANFSEAERIVRACGVQPKFLHLAGSTAVLARPDCRKNMVRPGLALYGYQLPVSGNAPPTPELKPVLTWKTRIITIRDVAKGEGVGYNHTWIAPQRSKIAVLPVGYADGLSRKLSSRGRVIVRGVCAPIVGRVSMDLTNIDVTNVPGAELGDEVTLLGSSGDCSIDAWEHARLADTIPYESLCAIAKRVPRVYVG